MYWIAASLNVSTASFTMTAILGKEVGPIGYGLLNLTHPARGIPEEQSIAAMKHAVASGANFWE